MCLFVSVRVVVFIGWPVCDSVVLFICVFVLCLSVCVVCLCVC